MAKIYVSSTYLDFQDYRAQVERVIRRMGHEDVAMEYYVAEDQRPVDRCLSDVAACDLYIGIFAWRYGWIPKKNNRKKLSITEMEYRQAQKTGKPCLIFLLDGKAPWPPDFVDDDKTQIKRLRNELSERHGTGPGFKSVDELGRLVAEAIHKWEKEHGYIPSITSIPEYNLDAYYQALRKRYQTLALEGLTPPQKEEYLQIHLRSVFVEQNVRESPPPVELPKEVWDKLQRDKDVHPEDLPSGITFDDVRRAREVYFEKPARPVLEVLTDARHQQTIILGDPGSGKSTLARYIMLSLIEPTGDEKLRQKFNGYLPLLVELRTYTGACLEGNCGTFLEFLEYLGKTEGWHLTKAALHHHLKNDGRAVVIFDGLDEIFDPEKREQITRQIVGFANDYPKVRIIVTSRTIGYRRKILTDAGFTHFTLQDLDEKQVETFVNRWYDLAMSDRPDEAKERKERILKSFKESPSIRQLAGNPMLLTIMAIIGKHQELPRERWKLYDHAASVLIQHWDVNKHLKDQRVEADFIGEDDKKELLRRLAFKMQGAEGGLAGNYIHRDDLHAEFENYLIQRYSQTPDRAKVIAETMIQQFRERNFILSLYGANLYGFVHRAFLEYFCASAFVYKFEKTKELTIEQLKTEVYGKHWEDQSWHEVLRLICGMIDEKWAGDIIDYLANDVYRPWPEKFDNRLPWNIAISVQCLSEVKNLDALATFALKLLKVIFELFIHQKSFEIKTVRFIEEQVISKAKTIFPNWNKRYLIADWLQENKPIFRDDYLNTSEEGAYFKFQQSQFTGLICSGQNHLFEFFLSYANSKDFKSRINACVILATGWRDDPRTFPLIVNFVTNDEQDWVRGIAIQMLVDKFRDSPETLKILQDRAVNDSSESVRSVSISGLKEFFINDPKTRHILFTFAVNDKYNPPDEEPLKMNVRLISLRAIIKYFINDPKTFPILADRGLHDPCWYVRQKALSTLAEDFRHEEKTISILHDRAVSDESPVAEQIKEKQEKFVREVAIEAIAKYWPDHPDTISLLEDRAKNDPTPWLRERAKELIKELTENKKKA